MSENANGPVKPGRRRSPTTKESVALALRFGAKFLLQAVVVVVIRKVIDLLIR